MGVSFTWRPATKNTHLFSNGVSSDHDALTRAFGVLPITLGKEHIAKLSGMSAIKGGNYEHNLYEEIIKKIEELGYIVVDTEY